MKLKKLKTSKLLLLKIFILQQKNRLSFNIRLKRTDLALLSFLWKNGYILGFTCLKATMYTIFLKKQFKQFSVNFFESKLNSKSLHKQNQTSMLKTPIVLSSRGLIFNSLYNKNIGGFLLCYIF
jgi:hypothetical protein